MTVAQNIREAAIHYPQAFLGDIECSVLDVFCNPTNTLIGNRCFTGMINQYNH